MMGTDLPHSLRILFMEKGGSVVLMRGDYGRMTWILADPATHLAKLVTKQEA